MKKLFLLIAYACAATVGAQTNSTTNTNPPPPRTHIDIDGYAAKVNDRVITIGEVREAMAPLLPEISRNYQGPELDQALDRAFRQTRDELVEQALILEAFKKRGGQIPDQYVNDEIRRIITERFNGDEAQFEQILASQKKSRSDYQDTVRDQMIVGMMVNDEINQRARVTPEEVRSYYEIHKDQEFFIPEKVKYSVIAINKGETPEAEQVKTEEAQNIRKQLIDGADFAETARESSEGSRAADGGLFPWMQPDEVRPELQEPLKTLPAGQISEIIETDKQYLIVKVEARRQPGYQDFDEVRDRIKTNLLNAERRRLRNRWIDRLKAENYIRIYED